MKGRTESGRFPRLLAVVLFLAVCAYGGAAVYGGLVSAPKAAAAQAVTLVESLPLQGMALRWETRLSSPLPARWLPEAGARIPAGGLLAELNDGSVLYADSSVLFFPETDGFEDLSPDRLSELSVAAVQALLDTKSLRRQGTLGRTVAGDDWYFAALAPSGSLPPPGSRVELLIEGADRTLEARLLAAGPEEDGQIPLLLRLTESSAEALSLRKCEASLILSVRTGLSLPAGAIYPGAQGDALVDILTADGTVTVAVEILKDIGGRCIVAPEPGTDALYPGSLVLIDTTQREG